MREPSEGHWLTAKGVFRYLQGTKGYGLTYDGSGEDSLTLTGYVDADWGGNRDNWRSTTGYVFMLGGGAVSWKSKLQPTVATSSTEAEYMAAYFGITEAIWI